jgi:hypothetical protein
MSEAAKLAEDLYYAFLEDISVSDPNLFMHDNHWGYFDGFRKEDPIHCWKEIPKHLKGVELIRERGKTPSNFVKGYTDLKVVVTARY